MLETAASVGWKVKDAIVGFHGIVGGLEAGQRNPTAVTLQRLAKVLGVTPTVFFL
jgi:transcriptional regulator with XRE-family HTH domain